MAEYEVKMVGRYITEHQDRLDDEVLTFAKGVLTPYQEKPVHYLVIARGKHVRELLSELPTRSDFCLGRDAEKLPDLKHTEAWYRVERNRAGAIFANLVLSDRVSCWVVQRKVIE